MRVCAVVLAVLVAAAAQRVVATTVVAPTLPELVAHADRIFLGSVTDIRSYWAGPAIRTDVFFRVDTVVKGPASPAVVLTFLGGRIGELTLAVAGMPHFAPGDEQVLFAMDGRQASPLVGFWHGRVRVTRHPTTGVARVLRFDGTPFETAGALTAPAPATTEGVVVPMRLEAFLDEIRRLVGRDGVR